MKKKIAAVMIMAAIVSMDGTVWADDEQLKQSLVGSTWEFNSLIGTRAKGNNTTTFQADGVAQNPVMKHKWEIKDGKLLYTFGSLVMEFVPVPTSNRMDGKVIASSKEGTVGKPIILTKFDPSNPAPLPPTTPEKEKKAPAKKK